MPRFRNGSCFVRLNQCTTKLDRNQRVRIIAHAEALERATKPAGKPSGVLGQTGLRILRCLLFDFHSIATGLCDPGYAAISRKTGFCNTTISRALQRLADTRIISVVRRLVRIGLAVEQATNAYLFHLPALLQPAIPPDREEPPQKYINLRIAKPVPWDQWSGAAKDKLEDIGKRALEAALASLGRAIEQGGV